MAKPIGTKNNITVENMVFQMFNQTNKFMRTRDIVKWFGDNKPDLLYHTVYQRSLEAMLSKLIKDGILSNLKVDKHNYRFPSSWLIKYNGMTAIEQLIKQQINGENTN